jgi:predicted lipoprotein with Yx(FWY)xxD motif
LLGLGALALAACSPSGAATPSSSPSSSTSSAPAASPALAVRSTSLGTILTDGRGFTLYEFGADQGTTSACTGACATAWPPATVTGSTPQAGTGVTQSLVGESTRSDGSTQLTYAGHPVYLFSKDTAPGNTSGQGLTAFGGSWHALTATGQEVGASAPATTPAPPAASTPAAPSAAPTPTCTLPQNNGGDHDADNNGGPDDGDGCDK